MRIYLYVLVPMLLLTLSGCGRSGDLFLPINEQTAEELKAASELLDNAAQSPELTEAQKEEAAKRARQSETDGEILPDETQ